MIEVKITYTETKNTGRYIYKDIIVKGHSSDGTINSLKCCAGVTAITCGLLNLVDGVTSRIEVNKGLFHFHMVRYDAEVNYAMNTLVYQLDSIQMTYPSYFKSFEFIEEKN